MSKGRGKYTLEEAEKAGRDLGVTFTTFKPDDLRIGMDVELEHGLGGPLGGIYNVTGDDTQLTAKIALAHLAERGDYYERLEGVEGPALIITVNMMIIIAVIVVLIVLLFWIMRAGRLAPPCEQDASAPTRSTIIVPVYRRRRRRWI